MSSCDMQGKATANDLLSLYWELANMTESERADVKSALFVGSKGFLNGQEAFEYLKNKI